MLRYLLTVALGLAAICACGSRTSLEDAPIAVESDDAGARCGVCLSSECTDFFIQCVEGAECAAILECSEAGGTADDCVCAHAQGGAAFVALAKCAQTATCGTGACGDDCHGQKGAFACDAPTPTSCFVDSIEGGTVPHESVAACEECVSEHCADFSSGCAPASPCADYTACVSTCDSSSCAAACSSSYPGGDSAAEALDVCLGTACYIECF